MLDDEEDGFWCPPDLCRVLRDVLNHPNDALDDEEDEVCEVSLAFSRRHLAFGIWNFDRSEKQLQIESMVKSLSKSDSSVKKHHCGSKIEEVIATDQLQIFISTFDGPSNTTVPCHKMNIWVRVAMKIVGWGRDLERIYFLVAPEIVYKRKLQTKQLAIRIFVTFAERGYANLGSLPRALRGQTEGESSIHGKQNQIPPHTALFSCKWAQYGPESALSLDPHPFLLSNAQSARKTTASMEVGFVFRPTVRILLFSNALVLSRPLSGSESFFNEEPQDEEPANSGSTQNESMVTSQVPAGIGSQEGFSTSQPQALTEDSSHCQYHEKYKKLDPLSRIEALQIQLFRLLQRLGLSPEDLMVAKSSAAEQEATGQPELDFSLKNTCLRKTGVGKSATINSIFDQPKAITNAFRPSTNHIQEVVGMVNGIAITVGPNGFPVTYESYVTQCTDLLQHYIQQVVSDTRIENPVVLVENHTKCITNIMGEKLLPNGQAWRLQLVLLCVCTKVLGDANDFLGFQDMSTTGAEDDIDEYLLSDAEEEDEYDQLPPIRILNRSQFEKLSKSQK
ncbi:hypothetical protein Ancab_006801 [Ancistrocladus abbreviatus]